MHPRICVSGISSWNQALTDDLALYRDLGVETFGLALRKTESPSDLDAVAHSGLRVGNIIGVGPLTLDDPSRWPPQQARLENAIALGERFSHVPVVLSTGPAGQLEWDDAVAAFARAIATCPLDLLCVEHTNSLRADVGFVFTLRDALDLAGELGVRVCMEINACWAERDLARTVRRGIDRIAVVQVSDYAVGTLSTPDRLVPGDGDIPLERIIGNVLDAGYAGLFDIELVGPRIEAEGYRSAISRSVEWLSTLLTRLGV